MSREYIAKKLKELRNKSGFTVYQVGELVGKSGKTVSAWENNRGQPDAEMLMKLCDIYKVEDILAEFRDESNLSKADDFSISDFEKKLICAYRNHPDMQGAINKMLDIQDNSISEDIVEELTKGVPKVTPTNIK